MSLLPVAEAQARLLALVTRLSAERVPLVAAAGRYASEDMHALRDQPAADLSAMDGYAIRFAERPGPWTVVGESKAGGGLDHALGPREAVRIFTGAPVPAGADSVLIQEEAAREGERLVMAGEGPPRLGGNVRPRAADFSRDAVLIRAGTRIDARHVALAAIGGHGTLPVGRRPRVALVATGDELAAPAIALAEGKLPASNSPMLAALIGDRAEVADHGILRDDLPTIAHGLAEAAATAEIVVTTGGVSVGDHDLVRPALVDAGATIDFWRVAMRPGKPLMAGRLGDAIVVGLPGNPVSAYVTATLFLLPLIAAMTGAADPLPQSRRVRLGLPLPATGARADYLRARVEDGYAYAPDGQDSAALVALAAADGLIVRPPQAAPAAFGDSAELLALV
ncbi:molybdopterin molybdotransferase MoeA [Sphingomonas sp.]|uniref:molybdopterin molybdotransferase MoeA n=1 Tax=Sphingomonas sp. TaxID=28214 RepID=UPI003B006C33